MDTAFITLFVAWLLSLFGWAVSAHQASRLRVEVVQLQGQVTRLLKR